MCEVFLMSESKIRERICLFGKSLFDRGLTAGSSGNISVRLGDGRWLATPTNVSMGFLDPAELSLLSSDGHLLSGSSPTKEIPLHRAMYDSVATCQAVVHLHSTHSVAVSMLPDIDPKSALPALTAYYLMKAGETAVIPYFRPGDPAVAEAIKGLAGRYTSVLLANHGPVVCGKDLETAVFATEELEETAKLHLLLRGLNPRLLSPEQIKDLISVFGLQLPSHQGHGKSNDETP
jgi:3-dehydro-4-phosphotetronate decarboxylase